MDRKELYKSITCALAGLVVVLGIGTIVIHTQHQETALSLRANYESSLYNTLDGLDTIHSELAKAEVSQDRTYKRELYRDISAQAGTTASRLCELPLALQSVQKTEEMLNHISDYCGFLSRQDSDQENEAENIQALRECCGMLRNALNDVGGMLGSGEDVFEAEIIDQIDGVWEQAEADSVTYPTLIYDGPFSQAEELGKPRQQREDVSQEQAKELASKVCDGDVNFDGEIAGNIPCYLFSTGDKSVAVSKQGGLLLRYMDSSQQEGNGGDTEAAAREFLEKISFPEYELVFSSTSEDSVIYNITPVQDDAALYPDIVKVQVSRANAFVIGYEGGDYIINNREREPQTPGKTLEEARERVSSAIQIEKTRLSIVPKGNGEVLAWEFYGVVGEDKYIVYIDANTLAEVNIFRIIKTENGDLVM